MRLPRLRQRPGTEEFFILNAMASLVGAMLWAFLRYPIFLEFFYFSEFLALTHLLTLGFITSLMMGVLFRLAPTSLKVRPRAAWIGNAQFVCFFIGSWGMIAHFWLGEWVGMSWSAILVWASTVLQLWNFGSLTRSLGRSASPSSTPRTSKWVTTWVERYAAAAMIWLFTAASLGMLIGLSKGYGFTLTSASVTSHLYAHLHLAGIGWVVSLVFGFQLKLVPTTLVSPRSLLARFLLLQLGTLGLTVSFLLERNPIPFAAMIAAACLWQAWGPLMAALRGRAREWELLPLLLLVVAAAGGMLLVSGLPPESDPFRARVQLAYAYLALAGFMVFTIVTVAFKLFPMWVWQERFQADWGKRPVPGMKDLPSHRLRLGASLALLLGVSGMVASILSGAETAVRISSGVVLLGCLLFVANFMRVARWGLLALEYHPTEADREKFRELFPERS